MRLRWHRNIQDIFRDGVAALGTFGAATASLHRRRLTLNIGYMDRRIVIELRVKETVEDVLAACNMISKNLGEAVSEELKADVSSPDSREHRSIVCRAHTEAFGMLKYKAMKYLVTGRTEDDNRLERLGRTVGEGGEEHVEYEVVTMTMVIPNFNTSATEALKSFAHRYVVDWVLWRFLQNQAEEKGIEYKKLAEEQDLREFENALRARESITNRTPDWV